MSLQEAVESPSPSRPAKHTLPADRHVGARLRQIRLFRGLSQEKLAAEIGLTFQQVQKYEKGVNRLSAGKLVACASVLGVSPACFFEGIGQAGEGPAPLDAADFRLVERMRNLPPSARAGIERVIEAAAEACDAAA